MKEVSDEERRDERDGMEKDRSQKQRSLLLSSGREGEGVCINRKDSLVETCGSVGQSWDCSQLEDELGERERDVMDRLEDDEMMRRWEEVSKEEEQVTLRRNEGRGMSGETVQHGARTDGVTGAGEEERDKKRRKKRINKEEAGLTNRNEEVKSNMNSKTRRTWCSGEASIRKKWIICGQNCARKWRRKS